MRAPRSVHSPAGEQAPGIRAVPSKAAQWGRFPRVMTEARRPMSTEAAPPSHPLQGLHRWLTVPSSVGGALCALVAIVYGKLTINAPPKLGWGFWVLAAMVVL